MAFDRQTTAQVEKGSAPTLRFFRWARPTVSYGRLQKFERLGSQIPPGWESVQRPTGGGLVYHERDLCLSICWRAGEPPLPASVKACYPYIHEILREALAPFLNTSMASCRDCSPSQKDFHLRECFAEPVVFDLLDGPRKIAGGALARQGRVLLYQGSIHGIDDSALEQSVRNVFEARFSLLTPA